MTFLLVLENLIFSQELKSSNETISRHQFSPKSPIFLFLFSIFVSYSVLLTTTWSLVRSSVKWVDMSLILYKCLLSETRLRSKLSAACNVSEWNSKKGLCEGYRANKPTVWPEFVSANLAKSISMRWLLHQLTFSSLFQGVKGIVVTVEW